MRRETFSQEIFERGQQTIVGGVNSPVRALRAVGGVPFVAAQGRGAIIRDVDDNEYVDYVLSYGPLILGHGHEGVQSRVIEQIGRGTSFGAPTFDEVVLAEQITSAMPAIELVRMVNSGTEATMSALRAARGFTGREVVVKFDGCYHGHADLLLVKSGSGLATFGTPDSAGVTAETARQTLTLPYNDPEAVRALFAERGGEIAAVILEPVAGNMGVIAPAPGFLESIREVCTEHGAVLIFDEVMTGFRLSYQGAQGLYPVVPDLVCLGKVIGGGLPVGAYGGRRDIMSVISPLGPVYQAGTLSGNPVSVAAGLATLRELAKGDAYPQLERFTAALCAGLAERAEAAGVPVVINRVGSMFTVFFTSGEVRNREDVDRCDKERFAAYFHGMRDRGVSLPPSQYEACFTSTAHGEAELERTLVAAGETFRAIAAASR